jgi:hypothetical protein
LHRIFHSRELYCALYFVLNVGEGNSARFSHDRVSECKELKERFSSGAYQKRRESWHHCS